MGFILNSVMKYLACFLFLSYQATGVKQEKSITQETYKAAVFDKAPLAFLTEQLTRKGALEFTEKFLVLFEEQSSKAASEDVDIIIFPEYGLYPFGPSRPILAPFMEYIPNPDDPEETNWNPCTDPTRFQNTEIQHRLSCMARNNSLYLVANMGNRIPCNVKTSKSCPEDHHFQYNTNVAYDPRGTLIARYHKKNPFFERAYDTPETIDYTSFHTPFGTFGTFTCFDVLFYEPSIRLIEDYQIDTIAFPTAWMNVLPYFSAVPFHQAFAIGMGVNFLSSNLHLPPLRFSGSGIYSSTETLAFRNDDFSLEAELLIANVTSKPTKIQRKKVHFDPDFTPSSNVFKSEVFGDVYNFVLLEKDNSERKVCHGQLCCALSSTRSMVPPTDDKEVYALGAFDGLHTKEGTYYIEVCAFVKCANQSRSSCGEQIKTATSTFDKFTLTGNFSSKYVFPMTLTNNMDPSVGQWSYDGKSVSSNGTNNGLVASVMFARRYDLDNGEVLSSGAITLHKAKVSIAIQTLTLMSVFCVAMFLFVNHHR